MTSRFAAQVRFTREISRLVSGPKRIEYEVRPKLRQPVGLDGDFLPELRIVPLALACSILKVDYSHVI